MKWELIIPVILYELIVICGISFLLNWLGKRNKQKNTHSADFVNAGGSLGPLAVAASLSLSALGGGHIIGLAAQAPSTGVGTYWYCLSSAIMVAIILCFTGVWYKRMHTPTVKYMFERLYDERVGMIHAGLSAGFLWGVITLEMQSSATVLCLMTGWSMKLCCIVGAAIAVLYVVFAGMKEAAWVNVVNALVMYAGVLVAAIYIGSHLAGGWESVNEYYTSNGEGWMLSLAGTSETWRT